MSAVFLCCCLPDDPTLELWDLEALCLGGCTKAAPLGAAGSGAASLAPCGSTTYFIKLTAAATRMRRRMAWALPRHGAAAVLVKACLAMLAGAWDGRIGRDDVW